MIIPKRRVFLFFFFCAGLVILVLLTLCHTRSREESLRKGVIKTSEYRAIEDHIWNNINHFDLAEELYRMGYLLFARGLYNEADQILRYVLRKYPGTKWADRSENVLLSKTFYRFYSTGDIISNVFWQTDIPDSFLFDSEDVRRKYGTPTKVEARDPYENWIYIDTENNETVIGEFGFIDGFLSSMHRRTKEGRPLSYRFESRTWVHPRYRGMDGLGGRQVGMAVSEGNHNSPDCNGPGAP